MSRAPAIEFTLAAGQVASRPPESRGLARDQVRLLVATGDRLEHSRFHRLAEHLRPGDVVVVNTSATRPSALAAQWRGKDVMVHLSTGSDDGSWVVEVRRPDGSGPVLDAEAGDVVALAGGGVAHLSRPAMDGQRRLWRSRLSLPTSLTRYLADHARPIAYPYAAGPWPREAYQTIFARPDHPARMSAEMPSAARPFTTRLVTELVGRGVLLVPLALHAGVSSPELGEPPAPEWYEVPAATASTVDLARREGRRVIAVGTTTTRALESAVTAAGTVSAAAGWTDLVLHPGRPVRSVTGLITGWHPPGASHLSLLQAVAGPELVAGAYTAALEAGLLWHEFGDSCLLLP